MRTKSVLALVCREAGKDESCENKAWKTPILSYALHISCADAEERLAEIIILPVHTLPCPGLVIQTSVSLVPVPRAQLVD